MVTPREVVSIFSRDEHASYLVVALIGSAVRLAQEVRSLDARLKAENDLLLVALEAGRYFQAMTCELAVQGND